jgi:hypothetical protein
MARSKKAKQWTGTLAEPFDPVLLGLIMPLKYPVDSAEFQKWIDDSQNRKFSF